MKHALTLLTVLIPGLALAQFPVTVPDGAGNEVTLSAPSERVACLITKCVHLMAALGVKPVAVGYGFDKDVAEDPRLLGEAAADIAVVSSGDDFDLEALAALGPDLIVAWPDALPAEYGDAVAPIYAVRPIVNPATVRDLGADLTELGRATGREEVAEAFLKRTEERAAAYAERLPAARPTVLPVNLSLDPGREVWALPCNDLYQTLAPCALPSLDWQQLTLEGVIAADPDVFVLNVELGRGGDFIAAWEAESLWPEIRAVKEGRVLEVENTLTGTYSVVSFALMLDRLAPLLYPDTFTKPLTDEEVQEILR